MKKTLLAAGLACAAVLVPAPAYADATCLGTSGTVVVCADPTGKTYWSDCVYAGGDTCTQVTVPGPAVTCGGMLNCEVHIVCTALLGCLPHPF